MKQYHDLLQHIVDNGTHKGDRTGVGTRSIFGYQMRFDLSKGFPIVTTKKISFKNIVVELLWFLRGDTNVKFLNDNGCTIWNQDAYNYYKKQCELHQVDPMEFDKFVTAIKLSKGNTHFIPSLNNYKLGDCGHQYGKLWRNWRGQTRTSDYEKIDQISDLIHGLKTNPESRRQIVTAWNPATLDKMALHACHALVQFNCRPLSFNERVELLEGQQRGIRDESKFDELGIPKYKLDCQLYQRSADVILGVPYNISSYCLLTHILCEICNMVPGEFIHTFGDVHIYNNHMGAVKEQLKRDPERYGLPTLEIEYNFEGFDLNHINDIHFSEFKLNNYRSSPKLENETKLNTGLK